MSGPVGYVEGVGPTNYGEDLVVVSVLDLAGDGTKLSVLLMPDDGSDVVTSPFEHRQQQAARLAREFAQEFPEEMRTALVASWVEADPEAARDALVASWKADEEAEMSALMRTWVAEREQERVAVQRRAAAFKLDAKRHERRRAMVASISQADLQAVARPTPTWREGTDPDGMKRGKLLLLRAARLRRIAESLGYVYPAPKPRAPRAKR